MTEDAFDLAAELEAGLREAVAHRRGDIELPTRRVPRMTAARVRAIRRKVAKSPKEFQRRFHISSRTLEGWESGKRVNGPSSVLLEVINYDAAFVESALASLADPKTVALEGERDFA